MVTGTFALLLDPFRVTGTWTETLLKPVVPIATLVLPSGRVPMMALGFVASAGIAAMVMAAFGFAAWG